MAVGHLGNTRGWVRDTIRADNETGSIPESDINLDVVELKGNERKSETRQTVEEETHWHVDGGSWDRSSWCGQGSRVTNQVVVRDLLVRTQSELVVDFEPLTVLCVNGGSTNRQLNLRNHGVSQLTSPRDSTRGVRQGRQIDLQIDLLNQIGVTWDQQRTLTAERCLASKVQGDRLHGEWSDLAVDRLP